ncbi:MAG: hypothetical protein RSH26_00180 [Clostridia bacterium]
MRKLWKNTGMVLLATCLLSTLPLPTAACATQPSDVLLYCDIPFEEITPKEMQRIHQEKKTTECSDENGSDLISDFGYSWYLDVDYNEGNMGASRVNLIRAGNGYATGSAFVALYKKDLLQFLDVERQLVENFGEPNARYFQSDSYKYNQKSMTKYMFPSGLWDEDMLENVVDNDKNLIAFSEWNNVVLRLWINWQDKRANGYLTKLNLQYFSTPLHAKPLTIIEYPRQLK